MTMQKQYLCQLGDITDPGSKGFGISGEDAVAVFIVRKQNQVYAYRNHCPHTGAPLEWKEDQFLDFENRYIQCAMHGALFEIDSGYCVRGPCAGHKLTKEKLTVEDDSIYLLKNGESKAETAPE